MSVLQLEVMIVATPAALYSFWLLRRVERRQAEPVSAHTNAVRQL